MYTYVYSASVDQNVDKESVARNVDKEPVSRKVDEQPVALSFEGENVAPDIGEEPVAQNIEEELITQEADEEPPPLMHFDVDAGYHNEPVREVEAVLPGPLIRYLDLRPTDAEKQEVRLQLKKWKTDLEALPCPIDKTAWLAAIRVQEPQLGFPVFLAAEVMIEAMEDRHRVLAASLAVKPVAPCEKKKPATTSAPTRSKRCTDMPSKIPRKKFTWCLPGASKMKDTAKIPEQSVPDQSTASCLNVSTMSFQALIEKPSDE